jgi:hypothetical protein
MGGLVRRGIDVRQLTGRASCISFNQVTAMPGLPPDGAVP